MRRASDPRQSDLFALLSVEPALAPPPLFTREAFTAAAVGGESFSRIREEPPVSDSAATAGPCRPTHPIHASDDRPYWKTSAHQWNGEILASKDRPAPIELTVRGIRTVIAFGMGFATHAVDPPGTDYWSETGYRSFTCCAQTDPDTIRAIIEGFIDGPVKNGEGRGGKLAPWWTCAVRQLQQHRGFMSRCDRVTPEMHERDVAMAEAVRAEGYDPEHVAPLPRRKRAA